MTNQFGDHRAEKPEDESPLSQNSNTPNSSNDELTLPSTEPDENEPLTVDGVRGRVTSALKNTDHETEIDLNSHLMRPFMGADGPTEDQKVILDALRLSAYGYFRRPDTIQAFLSVMEISKRALTYWFIPKPEFDEIRSKWFGLIDTLLQSEQCDIGEALVANDEYRLMATAQLLGVAKRLLEIDVERASLDTSDLSFVVAEGCRAITRYLEGATISPLMRDLVWLTVGELSDIAGIIGSTSLDTPLLKLFEKAIILAGDEEKFLPYLNADEEDDEDSLYRQSLNIKYRDSADKDEAEDEDEDEDLQQEIDPDEELVEVSEEELGTVNSPLADMEMLQVDSIPNADYGVTRLLYAIAKCQPRIPGNTVREHLWSCAISGYTFDHPSWNAGVLGMWIANEERAKGAVRSLLLNVFNWEDEEWEDEEVKKDLPDEGDTFALLVELLAREPQTAVGLEELFRDLPREVQVSISDICQDALAQGDIPVEWFDAGCRDVNKFEAEIARIFIVSN